MDDPMNASGSSRPASTYPSRQTAASVTFIDEEEDYDSSHPYHQSHDQYGRPFGAGDSLYYGHRVQPQSMREGEAPEIEDGPDLGEEEDEEEEDEEEEEEEEEEGDGASETSSAMYDPSADPEGFARRLDELAGTLEMSEAEARALRQGPIVGRCRKVLPLADFKAYLNHYLDSTEWQYAPPQHADTILRRQAGPEMFQPGDDLGQLHPIRALGRSWVGREVGGDGMEMMEGLGISDGLPRMADEGRVSVEGLMR